MIDVKKQKQLLFSSLSCFFAAKSIMVQKKKTLKDNAYDDKELLAPLKNNDHEIVEDKEVKGFFGKAVDMIFFGIDWFFEKVCYITCFPTNLDDCSPTRLYLNAVFSSYFVTWSFTKQWYGMIHLEITVPLAAVLAIMFFLLMKGRKTPRYFMVIVMLGIFFSFCH